MLAAPESRPTSSSPLPIARPIRALHLINGRFVGGGQKVLQTLIGMLQNDWNVDARLCTLGTHPDSYLLSLNPDVVEFDGRYNNLGTLFKSAAGLEQVLKIQSPDLLHTHGLDADLIGAIAARRQGVRHLSHLHITPPSNPRESWKAHLRRRLLRFLTWRADTKFIAVSEAVRQQMARYYRIPLDRIITVRNGIDLSEFGGPSSTFARKPDRPMIIGSAGRLAPMKGFEHLIDACGLLRRQNVPFELHLAGEGSERAALEQRAAAAGISGSVHFLGHVKDMQSFYKSVNVFALPSVSTEGLPLVVLESMAMGTPVIATDLAGAPEVIVHGVHGLLVPPGDAGSLAESLATLARDPDLCDRYSAAGLQRVRADFHVNRVGKEVALIYQQMISSQAR